MILSDIRHHEAEALPELRALLELAGNKAELVYHAELPWSSASFSGTCHTVQLCFAGIDVIEYAEAFIAHLPEHEFSLPGKLVADAAIIDVERDRRGIVVQTTLTAQLLVLDAHA